MKSKIVKSSTNKKHKFPLVAESTDLDLFILFVDETSGTVLHNGGGEECNLGKFSTGYISCFDSVEWKILDSVTITFES